MPLHSATVGTIAFSAFTLIACLFAVYNVYCEITEIWSELDGEMDSFKVLTDDLWKDMVNLGVGMASNRKRRKVYEILAVPTKKTKRAVYSSTDAEAPGYDEPVKEPTKTTCSCKTENKCPAGPPGPQGPKGADGLDGLPGKDGTDGLDAADIANEAPSGCFYCPRGLPGPPGQDGRPGIRGMPGARGTPGFAGRSGFPGSPGQMGPPGASGDDGDGGVTGEKGIDVKVMIGVKGVRGSPGPAGEQGLPGDQGQDGSSGEPGPPGMPGSLGSQGSAGSDGESGPQGLPGNLGHDAEYCPCPPRDGGSSYSRRSRRQEVVSASFLQRSFV